MKIALARLLLAFMLVWLPMQGYAIEAMPFCLHQHDDGAMQAAPDEHAGCHGQEAPPHHGKSISKTSAACDDCFSCHLIVQPALIVTPLALGGDSSRLFQRPLKDSFSLFFPEQPQRPPLAFFS
jgi:hypothetical protein